MKNYTALTVPNMAAINKAKKTRTAVSLFAGCGGSSTGHKLAGFRVAYANEFVEAARDTYAQNHPGTFIDGRDIRTVSPTSILKVLGMKKGELDLLDGSPPCSAFSTAGKRDSGWGQSKSYSDDKTQVVDDLFFEYVRILKGLKPKMFIAENVEGLVQGVAKGYFLEILKALKDAGYNVRAQVLDASLLGVPQARRRLIIVGTRNDLKTSPTFPQPRRRPLTVAECLPEITHIKSKKNGILTYLSSDRPSPTITASDGSTSETASFSCGGFCQTEGGPKTRRKYAIKELKVLFGLPEDFKLTGSFEQQWERIGRSVPPLLMYAVSREAMETLNALGESA